MGATISFTCPSCGYEAQVAGGRTFGMLTVVRTSTCHDCHELVDVEIGASGMDADAEQLKDPSPTNTLGRCPLCEGRNVRRWIRPRRCPKCKTPMDEGEIVSLWD